MNKQTRVLYSFPHKLGADRICYTAWQQVLGLVAAGADVTVWPGALHRPVPEGVKVAPTLARGPLRIPYRLLGTMRACALHDHIVARRLESIAGQFDVVHTWPLGALKTLKAASKLGLLSVLERPNAHTRFAYEVVQQECERLGVALPADHEHAYNADVLQREEAEYEAADRLLCPSEFVVKTFLDQGVSDRKLVRHLYGFDENVYYPDPMPKSSSDALTMLFVGVCAVRKGIHFALDAWLHSPASKDGQFLIAGEFLPAYADRLSAQLAHPSVKVLGHRTDVAELMRRSDILVLPSIEEGFGLVIAEAIGSGCVPLASDACSDECRHMGNGLMHHVGDVEMLTKHITMLYEDRNLLNRLRENCLSMSHEVTWTAAGVKLLQAYEETLAAWESNC